MRSLKQRLAIILAVCLIFTISMPALAAEKADANDGNKAEIEEVIEEVTEIVQEEVTGEVEETVEIIENEVEEVSEKTETEELQENTQEVIEEEIQEENLGEGGTRPFTELQELITQVSYSNDTITLTNDYEATPGEPGLEVNKSGWIVNLNLNGHTINRSLSEATASGYVIHITSGTQLVIKGSGIITGGYNTGNGGGIYSEGLCGLSGPTITGCTASNGGAVYVEGTGRLETGDSVSTIENCYASNNGGGIYVEREESLADVDKFGLCGVANIARSAIIKECSAGGNGGGIYSASGTVGMEDAKITECTASGNGAGIYIGSTSESDYCCGRLFAGSTAKVVDNYKDDDTASNVYIADKGIIIIGSGADVKTPKSGMSIGVTTANKPSQGEFVPITSNGSESNLGYFSSDDPAYQIVFNDNKIALTVPTPVPPTNRRSTTTFFTGTWGNPVSNGTWSYDAATDSWSYTTTRKFTNTWGYIVNPYAGNTADWFYFDENGKMLTGWHWVLWKGSKKCYYFNPFSDTRRGACQLGGVTPDGFTVDASGALTVNGIVQEQK